VGQNLAFPITLASRFYNSLYYRTSRDRAGKCDVMVGVVSRTGHKQTFVDIVDIDNYGVRRYHNILFNC